MWKTGEIKVYDQVYRYEAKVFQQGSKYGIAGGVISILYITDSNGVDVCHFDRGKWLIEPAHRRDLHALFEVLKIFTNKESEK